jgi:hypothetical protein
MPLYRILVKQLVADKDLRWDDRNTNPSGLHLIEAVTPARALDEFHNTVPIKTLDHFDITVTRSRAKT